MKWLFNAAADKERHIRFSHKLAKEIVDASLNVGRAIKFKQEIHRKAEANKAYAHYRSVVPYASDFLIVIFIDHFCSGFTVIVDCRITVPYFHPFIYHLCLQMGLDVVAEGCDSRGTLLKNSKLSQLSLMHY